MDKAIYQEAPESATRVERMRHSLAHIMAQAVIELFKNVRLGVGPVIENGFYYDLELDQPLTPEDLGKIEKQMRKIIKKDLPFERMEMPREEALSLVKKLNQPYKVEIINDLPSDAVISFYGQGDFTDLCRGPHVESTGKVGAFKLQKIAGAYWRGDASRPQLQRLYGLAFETEKELEAHLKMLEEAAKRDHRKLGQELDLFTFSELVGPGLPLWTPKGTLLRHLLDDYVWRLREKRGYQRVEIPHITKKELYERSGHWDKYKDDLFKIEAREGQIFAMKPMNCPHHTQIYNRRQWSYREMPQRYANTTMVYRDEQSGEMSGLLRVRSITQDDAHVFCRRSQVKEEFLKIWEIVEEFYGAVGFNLRVRLSLHDPSHSEKYLGDKELWRAAESQLREIASNKKVDWFEAPGEAAFYGPKVDFIAIDSIGRQWQVATIQLDMNQPERFDLTCVNEKGEKERIVMIHAAIMGSLERYLAVLIEHFAGAFPVWLAPVQVLVAPVSENFNDFAFNLAKQFSDADLRVEVDSSGETVSKKIRAAEKLKIPYMIVVGDKEKSGGDLAVRVRGQKDNLQLTAAEFIRKVKSEDHT